jgi:hypothetical protein
MHYLHACTHDARTTTPATARVTNALGARGAAQLKSALYSKDRPKSAAAATSAQRGADVSSGGVSPVEQSSTPTATAVQVLLLLLSLLLLLLLLLLLVRCQSLLLLLLLLRLMLVCASVAATAATAGRCYCHYSLC